MNLSYSDVVLLEKKLRTNGGSKGDRLKMADKDYLLLRTMECPVCGEKFKYPTVKASSSKLIGTDKDLRPIHDQLDVNKYDAIMCPTCGYAAITRYFEGVADIQKKKIREKICSGFKKRGTLPEEYSYDIALEHYKMALLNAVVKEAKHSELAYICLKISWIYRGIAEQTGQFSSRYPGIKETEREFTEKAYQNFTEALGSENFPMCGMDETTVDFLLANLAEITGRYDDAGKLVSKILVSPSAPARIKDKARDMKEELLDRKKE